MKSLWRVKLKDMELNLGDMSNLNIERMKKIHVSIALKRYKTKKEAAQALGITTRGLDKMIERWNMTLELEE